jgi:hypothetical protein
MKIFCCHNYFSFMCTRVIDLFRVGEVSARCLGFILVLQRGMSWGSRRVNYLSLMCRIITMWIIRFSYVPPVLCCYPLWFLCIKSILHVYLIQLKLHEPWKKDLGLHWEFQKNGKNKWLLMVTFWKIQNSFVFITFLWHK